MIIMIRTRTSNNIHNQNVVRRLMTHKRTLKRSTSSFTVTTTPIRITAGRRTALNTHRPCSHTRSNSLLHQQNPDHPIPTKPFTPQRASYARHVYTNHKYRNSPLSLYSAVNRKEPRSRERQRHPHLTQQYTHTNTQSVRPTTHQNENRTHQTSSLPTTKQRPRHTYLSKTNEHSHHCPQTEPLP